MPLDAIPVNPTVVTGGRNTQLTKAAMLAEITISLGGRNIDVELCDPEILQAMKDTLRVYNHYRPRKRTQALTLTGSSNRYLLGAGFEHIVGILELDGVNDTGSGTGGDYTSVDPFTYRPAGFGYGLNAGDGLSQIVQSMSANEQASKVYANDLTYRMTQEPEGPVLYVSAPTNILVSITYLWHIQPEWVRADSDAPTYGMYGLRNVDSSDLDWFTKYMLCRCKQILGLMRRKHGGIATADGGTDPTDGESLVAEGKQEEEMLQAQIKQRRVRGTLSWT